MRRKLAITVATATFMVAGLATGSAFAAQPNHQACLGHDFSGYAQGGAGFGRAIVGLAQNASPGIGTEVQAHLAGQVPDAVIENSCNNP